MNPLTDALRGALSHPTTFMYVALAIGAAAKSAIPNPDIPWDRHALKLFIFDFAHSITFSRNLRQPTPDAPNPTKP